ncbi:amidohydrolase family protein [Pseudomonas poae]|nr:amidohydrolase family protein [Pseudomonas poae]
MKADTQLLDAWIDIHAHFSPPRTDAQRAAMWHALQQDHWIGEQPAEWNLDERLAYMDRVGISMQMLSFVAPTHSAIEACNRYGAELVEAYPSRFGLLAGLPTDEAEAALLEVVRAEALEADGFAVYCQYNGVFLSDERLEPLWAMLNERQAVVFVHPNHAVPGQFSRPGVLLEVAYQTASVITDMLYAGVFRRYPSIRFILAHCGGALPAISGRLMLLGTESWVPNPQRLSQAEMRAQLAALYLDTAMTGSPQSLLAGIAMTCPEHLVYGSDCGAPCTTEHTAIANIKALLAVTGLRPEQIEQIGRNALTLFPKAAQRIWRVQGAAS